MLIAFCRYDASDEPDSCVLIDLSNGSWSNPAVDLAFFLVLSTTPMLRKTHEEDFLGYYHDKFTSYMHKLGEDPSVYPYRHINKKKLL